MKRKIYFLVSGVIQIFASMYAMTNADKLMQTMVDAMRQLYPPDMQARIEAMYQNTGGTYIICFAIINIILNIVIIYLAFREKLLKKKKAAIVTCVFCYFTSLVSISQLFSILNIVVLAASKKEVDSTAKKKELPVLEKEKVDAKKIILAIVLFVIYLSYFIFSGFLPDNKVLTKITSIAFYLIMTVLAIVFFYDLLSSNFKVFKKNFGAYVSNLIGKVGKYYIVYYIASFIIIMLTKIGISENQQKVETLPIFILFPLTILYAPLVEETLFRGCIRRFIKNDKLFIVVSAICFGLIHTIFSETSLYNIIFASVPYMIMGGFLAYLYVKTNNIWTNITFHAFHNTLASLLLLLINGI